MCQIMWHSNVTSHLNEKIFKFQSTECDRMEHQHMYCYIVIDYVQQPLQNQ